MSAAESPPPTIEKPKPSRSERLLALVRKLIEYGMGLAATLHHRPATDLRAVRRSFGIADLALILLRIKRGLLRAQALETRLEQSAARLDAPRQPRASLAQRKPRSVRSAALPVADPNTQIELPTEAEIAEWVRRRPIGAVIADICRDLGILPDHPLWRELRRAIMGEGGNHVRLVMEIIHRGSRLIAEAWFPSTPPGPAGTGPP
jgi:hypothetical protein